MAVYVDFCFTLGGRDVAVIGWGLEGVLRSPFALADGGGRLVADAADHAALHPRTDVADPRAAGFLMTFRLAAPVPDGAALALLADGIGPAAAAFSGDDLASFVSLAGEEPFHALLLAIGEGRLPPPAGRAAALVADRVVRRQRTGAVETDDFAAAIDEAIVDPESGRAVVSGWALAATDERPASAALLAVGPAGIAPMTLAFGIVDRPDLAGFRSRYPVGTRPGFLGTAAARARDAAGASAGLAVLVLARGGAVATVALPWHAVDIPTLLGRFDELTARLAGEARRALRRRLSEPPAALPPAPDAPAASADRRPVLALEHDGRTRHLRDVLGRLAALGWRDLDLALPGRTVDREVESAVEGARRDTPDLSVTLLEGRLETLAAAAAGDRPFVYLRSSMLLQADVAGWLADVAAGGPPARLVAFADGVPLRLDGPPAAAVATIAQKGLPFAAAVRGGPAFAALLAAGTRFVTFGGAMLGAIARFPEGAVEIRLDATEVQLGEDAVADRLFGRRTPRDFDRESLVIGG